MNTSKVYFGGLNGLRFVAAFAVLLTHVELTKKLLGHGERLWINTEQTLADGNYINAWSALQHGKITWLSLLVTEIGSPGMVLFFVMSGFLITYLLLEEKKVSGTISIKKFYMRRVLRIWPIYYLVVALGFFVLPFLPFWDIPKQEGFLMNTFWVNFVCYATIFPNLAFAIYDRAIPNIGQSWSIGVEEQFYLIWPVIMKFFGNMRNTILVFLFGVVAIKIFFMLFVDRSSHAMQVLERFLAMAKMDSIALGGLGAYWMFKKKENVLNFVYSKPIQIMAYLSVPLLMLFMPTKWMNVNYLFHSGATLIIIMNVAANPKSILKFNAPVLNYLGKITFGIYMYHLICITFSMRFLEYIMDFPAQNERLSLFQNICFYTLSMSLTIVVSHFSYQYFEKKFIAKKRNFTTVISGEDARP